MEVLALAQERLILVCPWPNNYAVDSEVIWKLEELMKRKVYIAIGWGHLRHINKANFGSGSMRQRLKSSSIFHSALPKLETLEQKYPD